MKLFLKKVHSWIYILCSCIVFILLYPFLYYLSRKPSRYTALNKARYWLAFLSSALAGFFYKFKFESEIDWSKPYVLCPNHTSNLDITAMAILPRNNFAFMGKGELLDNPVLAMFFKTIDIPVNRESKISAFRAFKRAEDYLKQGITLIIFPEGKIPDDYPPVLGTFKNGAFRLAIENNIPVVPITILNTWKKLWDDGMKYGSTPGICHICIHKPIETANLNVNDADELRDKVHNIIKAELNKYEA